MRALRREAPHATTVGQLSGGTDGVANDSVPRAPSVLLSPPSINMAMICNHLSFSDNFDTQTPRCASHSKLARIRVFTTYANRSPASSTSSTPRSSSSSSLELKSESSYLFLLYIYRPYALHITFTLVPYIISARRRGCLVIGHLVLASRPLLMRPSVSLGVA